MRWVSVYKTPKNAAERKTGPGCRLEIRHISSPFRNRLAVQRRLRHGLAAAQRAKWISVVQRTEAFVCEGFPARSVATELMPQVNRLGGRK